MPERICRDCPADISDLGPRVTRCADCALEAKRRWRRESYHRTHVSKPRAPKPKPAPKPKRAATQAQADKDRAAIERYEAEQAERARIRAERAELLAMSRADRTDADRAYLLEGAKAEREIRLGAYLGGEFNYSISRKKDAA
jgi:hypothetical protein